MRNSSANQNEAAVRTAGKTGRKIATALAGAALCAIFPATVRAQVQRLRVRTTEKLVSVSDPQISPDDNSIAATVGHVDRKEDGTDTQIVLVNIADGSERVLTAEHKHASSPRWSPRGKRLAFLAESGEGKSATPQIFILPMDGGEAQQITHAPDGVEQFAWRPDGKMIAYVTPDAADKKAIAEHHDSFKVGDTDYLETAAAEPSHVWLVSANGGDAKRITSGTWSLPIVFPPSPPASPLSWSPDGNSLLITRQKTAEPGDSDMSTIEVLDVHTGKMRKLTSHAHLESTAVFSPDGSKVAYWYNKDGDLNNQTEIFVAPITGGDGADVTAAIDRNIQRAIWMPDGKSLLVGGHDGVNTTLWVQPLNGPAKKLNLGNVEPSWSFWVDAMVGPKGDIAFTGSTSSHPTELYYMSSADSTPRQLTRYNDWISSFELARARGVDWQGPDGFHEDGVLDYPPGFSADKKYPLVLLIHGGPQAASTLSFDLLGQLIAAQGYMVFQPNYRGSDNLGNAYERAIYRDAGEGPGRDVMAGLGTVERMPDVDANDVAVCGWSYGGYMTSWMIGHHHIWKAAVSGAAVNDLVMEAAVSDGNREDYPSMGGSPWVGENWKLYREESPITYAAQISTPVLILSDTGDFRVPIVQSYEMYHALKDNGKTVEFYAYPVHGHFPGDPVHREDVMRRWIGWLNQYLK